MPQFVRLPHQTESRAFSFQCLVFALCRNEHEKKSWSLPFTACQWKAKCFPHHQTAGQLQQPPPQSSGKTVSTTSSHPTSQLRGRKFKSAKLSSIFGGFFFQRVCECGEIKLFWRVGILIKYFFLQLIQNLHFQREQINYRCVCANSAISGRGIEENSENFSNLRNLCNN